MTVSLVKATEPVDVVYGSPWEYEAVRLSDGYRTRQVFTNAYDRDEAVREAARNGWRIVSATFRLAASTFQVALLTESRSSRLGDARESRAFALTARSPVSRGATQMSQTYLDLSWSVSRGRETEGYNIARLTDRATGKRYRCMGGGYDMQGTVFGQWLTDVHQEALLKLDSDEFYGLGIHGTSKDGDQAFADGACGFDSMVKIAEAIGLGCQRVWNRRGNTIGMIITEGQES